MASDAERPGLTAKGAATRQRIIDGAAALLRTDDAATVTLDDILAATRTSKSQLFHYFPGGKDELFFTVASFEAERVISDQQPYLGELSSWAAWGRWRDAVVTRYREQGPHCPLSSLMNQIRVVPGAAEISETLLRRWEGYLERGILAMQERELIAREVDAARMAGVLVAGIQGGVVVLRTTGDTARLEAVLDVLIAQLKAGGPSGSASGREVSIGASAAHSKPVATSP